MNNNQEIDFHIELSTLKDFANKLIENKLVPINAGHIFSVLKQAVINSDVNPFLRKPVDLVKKGYYDKYVRLEEENMSYYAIPDFFSHEDDFYDMDRNLNFSRVYVNDDLFQELFSLKLLELDYSKINLLEFMNFQLYDNYNGKKEEFGYFLSRLLAKDSIFCLLPSINDKIQQWLKVNNISIILNDLDEELAHEKEDDITKPIIDHWEEKKNQKIEGNMSIDEIKHFFSFLYKEKIEKSGNYDFQPILTKEEVDMIFSNGLVIPEKPLEKKVKLCIPPRFPKKIIDLAIFKLFDLNSLSHRDKKDYLLFFANYIEDYKNALNSKKALESLAKNITGDKSPRDKIIWDNYIPERFL